MARPGKREKIYQMFNKFKTEAECFIDYVDSVAKFIFNDSIQEHIFEFVKICNYLLTEFDFIMNGKSHTQYRKHSPDKSINFDAIMTKRETVRKENEKLYAVDCQLGNLNIQMFAGFNRLKGIVSSFQQFLAKQDLGQLVVYELGKEKDVFQWLGKLPRTGYSVTFEGYDISHSISSHPWKPKSKKRSSTQLPRIVSAKKVKISADTISPSKSSTEVSHHDPYFITPEAKRIKVTVYPKENAKENVVTPYPMNEVEDKENTPPREPEINFLIQKYNFSNNYNSSEGNLENYAFQLFSLEQEQQTADRDVFLKILTHFVNLQCSFQDFFLSLERLVLEVKKREELNLAGSNYFQQSSKQKQQTMRDDLQRSARRCVSSIGFKIFTFLKTFKDARTIASQIDLICTMWPMATFSDSDFHMFQQSLAVIISHHVYAEDTLLVQLSTEGFQKIRKYLYCAIVQPSVKKYFQLNELDSCISEVEHFLQDKCCVAVKFSKDGVLSLLSEYFNSTLPSQPLRDFPKALRIRTPKKKPEIGKRDSTEPVITDPKKSEDSEAGRQPSEAGGHESQPSEDSSVISSQRAEDQSHSPFLLSQQAEGSSSPFLLSHSSLLPAKKSFLKRIQKLEIQEAENDFDSDDEFIYGMTLASDNDNVSMDELLTHQPIVPDIEVLKIEVLEIAQRPLASDAQEPSVPSAPSAPSAPSDIDIKSIIYDLKGIVCLEDVFENLDLFWEEDLF